MIAQDCSTNNPDSHLFSCVITPVCFLENLLRDSAERESSDNLLQRYIFANIGMNSASC